MISKGRIIYKITILAHMEHMFLLIICVLVLRVCMQLIFFCVFDTPQLFLIFISELLQWLRRNTQISAVIVFSVLFDLTSQDSWTYVDTFLFCFS